MGTKIFGILASAAIVAVIALALINFGNYRSLMPERPTEIVVEQVEEQTEAIEPTTEIDTMAIALTDSLALVAPIDTLRN
ncbi:MAG: hypothetical protein IKU92_03330 [Rikenellaceae bacterium]|nr:hypothetical protein [Rikenellaceae bacterium]